MPVVKETTIVALENFLFAWVVIISFPNWKQNWNQEGVFWDRMGKPESNGGAIFWEEISDQS